MEDSDEEIVRPEEDDPNAISLHGDYFISEEDEETLKMMEQIATMNSADFIKNNDVMMDPEIAQFFLMGAVRRERLERENQVSGNVLRERCDCK